MIGLTREYWQHAENRRVGYAASSSVEVPKERLNRNIKYIKNKRLKTEILNTKQNTKVFITSFASYPK